VVGLLSNQLLKIKECAMPDRDLNMQRFIDATEAAIRARATDVPDAMVMVDRVFAALTEAGNAKATNTPTRLEPCRHLENAYSQARAGSEPIRALMDAFADIEPEFTWAPRAGAELVAGNFADNHANAMIVGPGGAGGLEARGDVVIGVSLVAPNIFYPRHYHPPEELYIVLSPGEWMQNDNPMVPKQPGDIVHNPSNAWHAMRAMDVPLLAIWCLWIGQ
jgi:mannose-6-phosphate isomerase-like protein (cupin superfamily)